MVAAITEQQAHARRNVLAEVFRHSRVDVSSAQFRNVFVEQIERAFGAVAIAVWVRSTEETFVLSDQWNLKNVGLQAKTDEWQVHGRLLSQTMQANAARFVGCHRASNPTDYDILIAPSTVTRGVTLLIEVFRAPQEQQSAPESDLSLLAHLAEFAAGYLRIHELERSRDELSCQSQKESFLQFLHRSLDPHRIASAIANDGRSLIGCDRVSVLLCGRRRPRVEAISDQAVLAKRSSLIQAMEHMSQEVMRSGQPICWSIGQKDGGLATSAAVDRYLAESGASLLIVAPLSADSQQRSVTGVLVVEQFDARLTVEAARERVAFVANHGAIAIRNALEHHHIFLRGLRRRMSSFATGLLHWRRLLVMAVIAAAGVALATVPGTLSVEAGGELRAAQRQGLFAPEDGIVRSVEIRHGQSVTAGVPVVQLENSELKIEREQVLTQLLQNQERLKLREATRNERKLTTLDHVQLDADIAELREATAHLERRLALLDSRLQSLTLRAPFDGHISTWEPSLHLAGRPVAQGAMLIEVANESGPWQLEMQVAEDQAGYLLQARDRLAEGEQLQVEYILATQPERRYRGWLKDVSLKTDSRDERHLLLATATLDPANLPLLRDGSEVRARILCGQRPVGFVWFRDVIAFVHARMWF